MLLRCFSALVVYPFYVVSLKLTTALTAFPAFPALTAFPAFPVRFVHPGVFYRDIFVFLFLTALPAFPALIDLPVLTCPPTINHKIFDNCDTKILIL